MTEWSVRVEISSPGRAITEDQAEDVLAALKQHAPAVAYDRHGLAVRMCVRARDVETAAAHATRVLIQVLEEAGLSLAHFPVRKGRHQIQIVGLDVESVGELERSLRQSAGQELVGVAELAEILKVSKQRASEFAQMPSFPRPIAHLASGPIWKKTTILRHVGRWPRRPGRPKKTARTPD